MDAKPHTGQTPGAVVVGVDGSPGSVQALRWAARQGALTGRRLEVVHVWEYLPPAVSSSLGWTFKDWPPELAAAQRRLLFSLQKAFGEAARGEGTWPVNGLTVHAELREGLAGPVLCAAAHGASQLVVGAGGHTGAVEMLLGSVSRYVTGHAPCPVTVVREAEDLAALVGPRAAWDALAAAGGDVGVGAR
jgi:nucleotide-binding universal stress UspA family protein